MRDELPLKPKRIEKGIVNLDISAGPGSHWVAYSKNNKDVSYFDSYGNLQPPPEILNYFKGSRIKYNYENYQKNNQFNCGHLCLKFLYDTL